MKYDAIIVDLDRTLLRTDKSLSEYTISVLNRCRDLGMKIIVASARPLRNIVYYDSILNFDGLVVSNGARIIKDNNYKKYSISHESSKKIYDLLVENPDLKVTFETGDEAYSNVKIDYFDTIVCDNLLDIIKEEGCVKIIIGINDGNTYELVQNNLGSDVYSTIANGYAIQIMSKDASKWNGVSEILKLCNLDYSKCIYFGDDYDDIKPIENCGIGVAMENAIDECKKVSDYICGNNDEDGVAKFISGFIFKE